MRTFIFFTLAIAAIVATPALQNKNGGKVGNAIDYLINSTISAIIAKIPDPLKIPQLNVNLTSPPLLGSLELSNFEIAGLSKLHASGVKSDLGHLNMTWNLRDLAIIGKYNLDVEFAELVPLYGQGLLEVEFKSCGINFTSELNLQNGLSVSNVTVFLSLEKAEFTLNGFLENREFSAILSSALNDNFVPFVNSRANFISRIISPIVEAVMNVILHPKKSEDFSEVMEVISEVMDVSFDYEV